MSDIRIQAVSGEAKPLSDQEVLERAVRILQEEASRPSEPRSFAQALRDEVQLFEGLHRTTVKSAYEYATNNPGLVAEQVAAGAAFGAGFAMLAKNPGLLGTKYTHAIMTGLEKSMPVFASIAVADWTMRVGSPMLDVLHAHENLPEAKKRLAANIGTGLVDYGAGTVGGIGGGALAWKLTPGWINRTPAFERYPSRALGEKPRELQFDEKAFITTKENSVGDDVVELYLKSFPLEERQPVDEVKDLVAKGRIIVHGTRDQAGKLQAFSFTSLHDETATQFANLDFIATEEALRSKGIGSLHFSRLREIVAQEHPNLFAMTLEMEHPAEAGIDDAVRALRLTRTKFYDRLDTPDTNIKYNILDFEDPAYRGPAQWRAWVYKPDKFNAVETARTMYMDEGGYMLSKVAREVKELDRANNYWLPPFGQTRAGLFAGPATAQLFPRAQAENVETSPPRNFANWLVSPLTPLLEDGGSRKK